MADKRKEWREAKKKWRENSEEAKQKERDTSARYLENHPEARDRARERAREWRKNNPGRTPAMRLWEKKNPEKYKAMRRNEVERLRREVIAHYGARCACCGEENRSVLSLDHINNDGAQRRKEEGVSGLNYYRRVRQQGYPERYQVLCYNCNCARPKGSCRPHAFHPIYEG